jgi:hypothetical protein
MMLQPTPSRQGTKQFQGRQTGHIAWAAMLLSAVTGLVPTTNAADSCNGKEDPKFCANKALADYCGTELFGLFDLDKTCPVLCGTCSTTTTTTTITTCNGNLDSSACSLIGAWGCFDFTISAAFSTHCPMLCDTCKATTTITSTTESTVTGV